MSSISNQNDKIRVHITVFDLVMMAPIQLQYIFSYTILANPLDNFGTVVGENPDCLLLSGTVVGENPDHVCWES